jgi:hypothetical protein
MFIEHGNHLTVAEMNTPEAHYKIGTKYTSRISDLRKKGCNIPEPVEDREHPGNNLYTLLNPDFYPFKVKVNIPRVLNGDQYEIKWDSL